MGSPLRALIRVAGFVIVTVVLLPVQIAIILFRRSYAMKLPMFYHAVCCRIFGIHILVKGALSSTRPTLYVCNHISYLDIVVLGSLIPGSFVSRADLAKWPLFGLLAKLRRTVFIDRRNHRAAQHRDEISARLQAGGDLILFPEGTSDDGNSVLPFKSTLFDVAAQEVQGTPLTVQPVSIAYTRLDGLPIGRALRPYYAWYGAMKLIPHAWRMLGLGHTSVLVEFHPPLTGAEFESRKTLAAHCHRIISAGLAAANTGRDIEGFQEVAARS